MKTVFITGITGQTGSYLCERYLSRGYKVHGLIRRASNFNTHRIDHLYNNPDLKLHYGDLSDGAGLYQLIHDIQPDYVLNMAAQSHVKTSFDQPIYSVNIDATGTMRILEAVKNLNATKEVRFYQASSSEMFGSTPPPQNELTPFHPRSPYACAKVYSYWQTVNYREAYKLFACNGISFNHESERRGETFVTRKVTRALTRIKYGLQDKLVLGNIDAKRDWAHAQDISDGIIAMLDHSEPDDFVLATGESHSVKEWLDVCGEYLKLDWHKYVVIDERYYRPTEVDHLCGDATKAKKILGWEPKIKFKELACTMIDHDMKLAVLEANQK